MSQQLAHKESNDVQQPAEKPVKSRGEQWFDRLVYGVMNPVGTFVVTLPIAYWMKYGGGKKLVLDNAVKGMAKAKVPAGLASEVTDTLFTMQGGNVMVFLVAAAESFRRPFVRGLNAMLDEKHEAENIQEAPKQTAGSLVKGRIAAFTTVLVSFVSASFMFPETFRTFKEEFAGRVCQVLKKAPYTVPLDQAKLMPVKAREALETKAFRYGKLAALDVFATAMASTLFYIGSHVFAERREKKLEAKEAKQPHTALSKTLRDEAVTKPTPANDTREAANDTDTPRPKVEMAQLQSALKAAPAPALAHG
jgi:hypothetical protein